MAVLRIKCTGEYPAVLIVLSCQFPESHHGNPDSVLSGLEPWKLKF